MQHIGFILISLLTFSFVCGTNIVHPAQAKTNTSVDSANSLENSTEHDHQQSNDQSECVESTTIAIQHFENNIHQASVRIDLFIQFAPEQNPEANIGIDGSHYLKIRIPNNFLSDLRTVRMQT